ncbi:hypothetical protein FS837_000241 [Tulasnella sp. UAMH 9824]|nr:hypothetical protein FS837_000241 [Tulasnella sp. UAMH 9824]
MQTSNPGHEPFAPAPSSGHVQIGLDQDKNQDTAQVPASNSMLAQASTHEVAPDPEKMKLSLEERLGLLSKYRIFETEIENIVEPTGRGGKADVVRARFKRNDGVPDEQQVAVKKLRCDDGVDEKFSKDFVHEVELLARLSHKNIVRLVGFVEDLENQKAWVVLSWASNGHVRDFLASAKWEIPERISLIKDMFAGLQYLHKRQPPICHGDLKSLNILVSSSCRAVITDFGSARERRNDEDQPASQEKMQKAGQVAPADDGDSCPEVTVVAAADQLTLTGPAWSLRWAAPEVVSEEARPGLASDIWSAGWVCWEMMTNRIPFEELKRDTAVTLKVMLGQVPLVREDTEVAQVIRLCSLMTDCWKYKPEDRPHVDQCCSEVRWMPSILPLRGTSSDSKELSYDLLVQMGKLHYQQDRPEKAAELFEKVVTNTESAVPQVVLAEALMGLGDVHCAQCKYAEVEKSYMLAQEICARIGNGKGQANTFNGLGRVYYAQEKHAEAEESYTRAQEIYARIRNDHGRANTLDGLGDVYYAQCKYAEAEESYTRAQEICARIGDEQGRANILDGLGDVYHAQCKYAEAEESYTRAQEIYARIGDDLGQANTLLGIESGYSEMGSKTNCESGKEEAGAIVRYREGKESKLAWGRGR